MVEFIAFQARFGGVAQQIFVPVERVAAIYARESNEGMGFEVTEVTPVEPGRESRRQAASRPMASTVDISSDSEMPPDDEPSPPSGGSTRPRFTVVKVSLSSLFFYRFSSGKSEGLHRYRKAGLGRLFLF